MTPELMASVLEVKIKHDGKWHIVERLRLLLGDISEEEKRIDLIFVMYNDEFGESDRDLLLQYVDWMENTLLKEMADGTETGTEEK